MSTTSRSPSVDSLPVSISSRFNLEAWDMQDADVLLLTPDQVFFYTHRSVLLRGSSNFFGGLFVDDVADNTREVDVSQPMSDLSLEPKLVPVNIPSDVLNVVLLALYEFPIQKFAPSNEALREVILTLTSLGYDPSDIACPRSELFSLLLKSAAADPLRMYAAAAQCSFESLAVSTSALTLRTPLHEITDELARQMGPVYLRRLFFLHLGRADALRRIVLPLPNLHPPGTNDRCNAETQKGVQRAWTLASAYIIAQSYPGDVNGVVSLLVMSSTSSPASAPTPNFDPSPNQPLWAPPSRGVYTYSFLGGMALIAFIVLIFVFRAYYRRRQFAIRVQRALDAGRLDPGLVQEIRDLPSGALYFSPSNKLKKAKIRPVLYEVYLGDPESKSFNGNDGNAEGVKVDEAIDWRKITPVAVTKLVLSTDDSVPNTPLAEPEQTPGRNSRFNIITSVFSSPRTEPAPQRETTTNPTPLKTKTPDSPTPPPDSLALSVFIAMPSPTSRLSRAKLEGEEIVPDVCLGVTRVDVVG
ncbi:unnamed protein product [Rhizoctonia solani]|uniref:BTB domain-containing protein n=1 Tax=Rhizoctonia solani TaxID=456999 RepID=A0A8H3BRP4_9AGAM|nr:unnamed protein product [Rhizoctonia solani]